MRFAPTEDETMVEDTLDRLLADAEARAPRGPEGAAPMPEAAALRATLAELGLWGAWLPERLGGSDGGPRMLMTLARGLGRRPSRSGFLESCVLGGAILARSGAPEARALATRLAAGEAVAAAALLEPGRRWALDPAAVVAAPDGDGVALSGTKAHVALGGEAEALLVSAAEPSGPALFLVPADAPGLSVDAWTSVDGAAFATVRLEGVRAPASARILAGPGALSALEDAHAVTGFAMAAEVLGACETCLSRTVDYLRTREQFGRPLGRNQALQHRCADLHSEIEMLRSQVLGAAAALDRGVPRDARADVAAAAAMAVEIGDLAGREAIHLHGAIGMTRELGIGRHLMRVDTLARWLGDARAWRDVFLDATLDEEAAA